MRWTGRRDRDSLEKSRRATLGETYPHSVAYFRALLAIPMPLLPDPCYVFRGGLSVAPGIIRWGRKRREGLEREMEPRWTPAETQWERWKNSGLDTLGETSPNGVSKFRAPLALNAPPAGAAARYYA